MATLFKKNNSFNNYGYTMMEKEDPQDKKQREAQFLIYKTLKQADQIIVRRSSRPSWLKLRICKLKVRIGKRLLRLRKTMLSNIVKTKMGVYKQVMVQLKNFKRLFNVAGCREGGVAIGRLPQPLFT
ncbi:uncharacterized protein LOC110687357 [Chenopodium quinoa]|uniref:uncharacterized protein LOC110687357 n=1 Tax=Chenopodium quinoa TaxID=63459 RepID=UPI000B79438E|nr:uncharacterized protein LOC110687357 [Chenopodium quinoa]